MIATVLFASRDTAMMYYGDEIGMVTTPPTRKEDVKDPIGITGWPKQKGRDGERTPMQWNDGADAGFSPAGVKTWLPIPPSYSTINVTSEQNEQDSMLHWYQQIIALKKQDPALHDGAETMLNTGDGHVLSWLRKSDNGEAVVVACNFSDQPQTVSFDLSGQGIHATHVKTLMKTPGAADPASIALDSARGVRRVHRSGAVRITRSRGPDGLAADPARRATGNAGIRSRSNNRAGDGTPR